MPHWHPHWCVSTGSLPSFWNYVSDDISDTYSYLISLSSEAGRYTVLLQHCVPGNPRHAVRYIHIPDYRIILCSCWSYIHRLLKSPLHRSVLSIHYGIVLRYRSPCRQSTSEIHRQYYLSSYCLHYWIGRTGILPYLYIEYRIRQYRQIPGSYRSCILAWNLILH